MVESNTLKARIDQALKQALLGHDADAALILRGLKSAILYEEVAKGLRETGLNDSQIEVVIARESKKRLESADIYAKNNSQDKADKELSEKELIDTFLPKQMTDDELSVAADAVIAANPDVVMGKLIGLLKEQVGTTADGNRIATMIRAKVAA